MSKISRLNVSGYVHVNVHFDIKNNEKGQTKLMDSGALQIGMY